MKILGVLLVFVLVFSGVVVGQDYLASCGMTADEEAYLKRIDDQAKSERNFAIQKMEIKLVNDIMVDAIRSGEYTTILRNTVRDICRNS